MTPATNPFSTRHVRPGRIVPLDEDGMPMDIAALAVRLRRTGGMAAIVGPHGSGKSTLLSRLADAIEADGTRVVRLRLRSWRDAWRAGVAVCQAGRHGTVCIDGWESLAVPVRGLVRLIAWGMRRVLVVTTHARGRTPVLACCRTSPSLLESIVTRLPGAARWYGDVITSADVAAAFQRHRGDVREALFELYDLFECRSRRGSWQRS